MPTPRANWIPWAVAGVPVLIALLSAQSSDSTGAAAILNLLGRLTGIGGLSCLLVAAALSCRVPGFDRPFGGLTKLWKTHHQLGAASFLLLLAHPVLLAFAAAGVSLPAAAATLLPPRLDWGVWLGWAALLTVMVFLAPSFKFFGEPDYQRWRYVHRLAALAIVAALAHTYAFARTIPEPWSGGLWLLLFAAAVGAVAYRLIFSRHIGRLPYTVDDVARPANNIVELTLQPKRRHLHYAAGQFVYLTPFDRTLPAGYGEEHPYTLSSAPGEPDLRVAIKDLGDASRALQHIAPGSRVGVEGPYGDFFPRVATETAELWIAGGIGVTPFLGRLRHLAATGAGLDAHLVYCVQDESRAHFAAELGELAESIPGIRLTLHYFYQHGPLTADFLARHVDDYAGRRAYVCGPMPLLERVRAILIASGVARSHIVTEEFALL